MADSNLLVVRYPGPGCVVEFMQGDKPQTAWVLEEQSGRFRVLGLNKREMKLTRARILPWTGPQFPPDKSREEIQKILEGLQAAREELESGIDSMEIWELAQGEVDRAGTDWFAELVWDKDAAREVDRLAAMGRAMLRCKTHFKFHPPEFEVYPEDKVLARIEERKKAEERERLTASGRQFFQELWGSRHKKSARPENPPDPEMEARLKELLLRRMAVPDDSETDQVWKIVSKGLPDSPHLPLLLAQAWGLVPPHHNYLLDQAGYKAGDAWSGEFEAEIEKKRDLIRSMAKPAASARYFSIDSATTRDIDDAFSLSREVCEGDPEKNPYRLSLALACPVLGWDFNAPLEKGVAERCSSIYLPEGVSHMLPESLGADLFSLIQGEVRPALALDFEIGGDGRVMSCTPRLDWIRVEANLSYEGVEEELSGAGPGRIDPEAGRMFELGVELAEKLRRLRISQGAIVIERQEPEIVLSGEGESLRVELLQKPECPRSQLLVSELMILANSGLALWAAGRDIPLFFRTQNINTPKESAGVWSEPQDIHRVVKVLAGAVMDVAPRPHAGIGVEAYSPVSSPLRRYPDLVNLVQIVSYLETGAPRFDREKLSSMLVSISARQEAVLKVQRFRPRYWKLLYLKQQGDSARHSGVVVEENQAFVTTALPRIQIFIRGPRKLFGDKIFPGQTFQLRLGRIDPLHNEISVIEAWEE